MENRCNFPSCKDNASEMHHITYEPPSTTPLCHMHHVQITDVNTAQSLKEGKLSSEYRRVIWQKWLDGKYEVIFGISWMHDDYWRKGQFFVDKRHRCPKCYSPLLIDLKNDNWKCLNRNCEKNRWWRI